MSTGKSQIKHVVAITDTTNSLCQFLMDEVDDTYQRLVCNKVDNITYSSTAYLRELGILATEDLDTIHALAENKARIELELYAALMDGNIPPPEDENDIFNHYLCLIYDVMERDKLSYTELHSICLEADSEKTYIGLVFIREG